MKRCELCCNSMARMFCESDGASLCWECDAKVHSANFLVAKHTRTLLCQSCHSLTPWSGSGPKLGPSVSVCHSCLSNSNGNSNSNTTLDDDDDDDDEQYNDDDDDEDEQYNDDDDDDDDDEDNQVVPVKLPN